jgi:hypothetical protein
MRVMPRGGDGAGRYDYLLPETENRLILLSLRDCGDVFQRNYILLSPIKRDNGHNTNSLTNSAAGRGLIALTGPKFLRSLDGLTHVR